MRCRGGLRAFVLVIVVVAGTVGGVDGIARAEVPQPLLRISPTAFDFGDVPLGTSEQRTVDVVNPGPDPLTLSMAGGAAGPFGGSQNCQGRTLAAGESCHITYTFAPDALGEVTGSTGGSINGQSFAFQFVGNGVRAFQFSTDSLDFGDLAVGSGRSLAIDVINVSGADQLVSMAGGAAGAFGGSQNCQGRTLAPGESCHITYTFAPDALGEVTGSTGGSINGQSFAFDFVGTGIRQFDIFPTSFDFGDVPVGSARARQATVTNAGDAPAVVSMAGGAAGAFGGSQNCQGRTLAPGESCQITYMFAPDAPGEVTGSTGGSINGQSFAFDFVGTGVRQFDLSGSALDFGAVLVGDSRSQSIDVTNVGDAPALVSMAGGAAGAFGGSQNCQGRTLAPGESCQITYTFAPDAPGEVTGSTGGSINGQPFAFTFRGLGDAAAPLDEAFMVSPTSFDFGDAPVGTSETRIAEVTNASDSDQVVSMAGGAAGAFGGSQNCQGRTLAPGESCQITYTFAPDALGEVTGSTGGSINGQSFAFDFVGTGVRAFVLSGSALDFGDVGVGTGVSRSVDVTNVSGADVTVSMAGGAAGAFGGSQNCQGRTLAPGESCQITYTFTPDALGEVTGSTGGSINGQPFAFDFVGTGVSSFVLGGTSFDAGDVPVGSSRALPVSVTNVADDDVMVSMAGGAAGAFGGSQNCQGRTLAPGESCQITYTFAPDALGEVTGSTGGSLNGQPFAFDFVGTGIRQFDLSATGLDFGPVAIGASLSLGIDVTNAGTAPAPISMAGGAAGAFGGSQNCQGRTLAPGESCRITYTFAPDASGRVDGATGGSINDQPFAFTLTGFGVGDSTPPEVIPSVDPPAPDGLAGWYVSSPTVSFSVDDPESPVTTSGCDPTVVASDTAGTSLTCTAQSEGGTTSASVTIRRDATPPTVTCDPTPSFTLGSSGVVTGAVTDATSGPATTSVSSPADTSTLGEQTASVTGTDTAGNTTTVDCGYRVVPVLSDLDTPRATARANASVPVMLTLSDAHGNPLDDDVAGSLADACAVVVTSTFDPGVRTCAAYDARDDQFVAVLRIPRDAEGTHTLTATVELDGAELGTASTTITVVGHA